MVDYYNEDWLDSLEKRFEAIVIASQKARKINEGSEKDPGTSSGKVVVKALQEVMQVKDESHEKAAADKERPAAEKGAEKDKEAEEKEE